MNIFKAAVLLSFVGSQAGFSASCCVTGEVDEPSQEQQVIQLNQVVATPQQLSEGIDEANQVTMPQQLLPIYEPKQLSNQTNR